MKGKMAGGLQSWLTLAIDCAIERSFNRSRVESRPGTMQRKYLLTKNTREKSKWNISGKALPLLADKLRVLFYIAYDHNEEKRKEKKKSGIIGKVNSHIVQKEIIMRQQKT